MPTRSSSRQLPEPLELTEIIFGSATRTVRAAGREYVLAYAATYFPEYAGPPPNECFRKPVVAEADRPFAELQVVKRLTGLGWTAGWAYRSGQFISSWEPHKGAVRFPPKARALLERIAARAGSDAGCPDVVAWKNGKPLFLLMKRSGSSDRLRAGQMEWLEAARAEGVKFESIRLLEWYGGALDGRVLTLEFFTYDNKTGSVQWRDGQLTFDPPHLEKVFQHYAAWGAKTQADLLWLVFARNCDGITWCAVDERNEGGSMKSSAAKSVEAPRGKTSKTKDVSSYSLNNEKSLAPLDISYLPRQVLRMAYKSPGEFGFRARGKAKDRTTGEQQDEPLNADSWFKRERYVNQVLAVILFALSPAARAAALNALAPGARLGQAEICKGTSYKLGIYIGEPDVFLLDPAAKSAALVEIKIGATQGNDRYSFGQYTKYMRYAALLKAAGVASQVTHFVVAPSDDPKKFCKDYAKWKPSVGKASPHLLDPGRGSSTGRSGARWDREQWIADTEKFLRKEKHRIANGYDETAVDALSVATSAPSMAPTYVADWNRTCGVLASAAREHGAAHLEPAIEKLRLLGNGVPSGTR